jgi:hypothetical protein
MTGLTDFITEAKWEDVLTDWFVMIDDAHQALERRYGRWRKRGPQPRFADSEVLTVGLLIDTWFGGDEAKGLAFVRQYHHGLFPRLPSNGQFNTRRRALGQIAEQVRRCLLNSFGMIPPDERLRLIDSAPVRACQYGRAARCRTVSGPEYVGLNSVNKARFLGFRLQATISPAQVVDDWMLAPAARKDGKTTSALLSEGANLHVFGDNAYHDPGEHHLLAMRHNVRLWAVPRKDARLGQWPKSFKRWVKRLRLRIETTFSVLETVFHLETPRARSLTGLIARTATRVLAYTLCFLTAPRFANGHLAPITPN